MLGNRNSRETKRACSSPLHSALLVAHTATIPWAPTKSRIDATECTIGPALTAAQRAEIDITSETVERSGSAILYDDAQMCGPLSRRPNTSHGTHEVARTTASTSPTASGSPSEISRPCGTTTRAHISSSTLLRRVFSSSLLPRLQPAPRRSRLLLRRTLCHPPPLPPSHPNHIFLPRPPILPPACSYTLTQARTTSTHQKARTLAHRVSPHGAHPVHRDAKRPQHQSALPYESANSHLPRLEASFDGYSTSVPSVRPSGSCRRQFHQIETQNSCVAPPGEGFRQIRRSCEASARRAR